MRLNDLMQQFMQHASAASLTVECAMDGDPNAELAIVCERPGPREVQMKLPLVGGSGQELWKCLSKYGISRSKCYITNVIKKQLPEVDGKLAGISKNERSHWDGLLRWELQQLPNLRYVLVLGNTALETVVGEDKIDLWRGSVIQDLEIRGVARHVDVVMAWNPAMLFRKPSLEPIFQQDMAKLDIVMRGKWSPHIITPIINPSPREAVQWCDKMISEDTQVATDIETSGGETACVGFANEAHTGMCINLRTRTTNRFSVREEQTVRTAIQRVVRHARVRLVAQNGAFDAAWLWYKDRIRCKPLYLDTLLGHHTLHPTWPHGLAFLTAQYTTHPYYKDDIHEWREGGDINTFWQYNVKDCCITYAAAQKIEASLKRNNLWGLYETHVRRLQPHLIEATVLGNRIDMEMKAQLNDVYAARVGTLEAEVVSLAREATGDRELALNPNSPKQLADVLFRRLRLVGKSTSTDENNRNAMIASPRTNDASRALLIKLNEYKEQHKLFSTYVKSGVDPDDRMRSDYKQYGTQYVPGRLSSSQTLWGSGMNLQNQPELMRPMFIADTVPIYIPRDRIVSELAAKRIQPHLIKRESLIYVYFDGAQAEARIVAYEADIPAWKHQFEQARLHPGSYDAHCALASEMFNVPYDDVPKSDWDDVANKHTIRYTAKRCRHGLNYRMQADRLATVLGCTLSEAERLWALYHRATPELQRWWNDIIREVRTTRTLYTCFERRMEFLGSRLDESLLDSIIAFKPQSTLGDFVCMVQHKTQDDPTWPRTARIPFNNHDSLTALCRESDAATVGGLFIKYAEAPIIIKGEQLIIPIDLKRSYADEEGVHRWSNMKKFKLS
jgi:uracil-DNA glycosylase family 4